MPSSKSSRNCHLREQDTPFFLLVFHYSRLRLFVNTHAQVVTPDGLGRQRHTEEGEWLVWSPDWVEEDIQSCHRKALIPWHVNFGVLYLSL